MPRSASRSCVSRKLRWKRKYTHTAWAITSAHPVRVGCLHGCSTAAIRQYARGDVVQRLVAREEALQLFDHEAEKAGSTGGAEARDMRRQEYVRQAANLTVFRDRLRVEHIQTHADVALLGPRDERVRVDDTTA